MLLEQRPYWPDDAVGAARALGGVEEEIELRRRGQPGARARHGIPVALQDPRPQGRREPEEECGEIVAERPDTHVVPVDQPRPRPLGASAHEDVGRPEVAVEERVRSGCLFEDPRPPGYLGQEPDQPLTETVR